MNILDKLGLTAFTGSEDETKGDFYCNGEITMEVPTEHNGNTESLGGGTLALEHTTDGGDSYRTYTDAQSNAAATLSATGAVKSVIFAGKTRCRLSLTGSTNHDVTCVWLAGDVTTFG